MESESLDTKRIALASMMAVLYVVLTAFPFSAYIGGPGFITTGCFLIPVIAMLLPPVYAGMSGLLGGIITSVLAMGYGQVMPVYGWFIPSTAAFFGSFAFRKRPYIPMGVLILEGLLYLYHYQFKATPMFLAHYVVAIVLGMLAILMDDVVVTMVSSIALTTMVENAMLNVGSMFVLHLPAELWVVIAPTSFMERAIILVVSYLIIMGLVSYVPGMVKRVV